MIDLRPSQPMKCLFHSGLCSHHCLQSSLLLLLNFMSAFLPVWCDKQMFQLTTCTPSIMECTLTQVIIDYCLGLLLIFKFLFLFPPPSSLTTDTRYNDFVTLCTAESLLAARPLRGQKGHPCRLYPMYVIISPFICTIIIGLNGLQIGTWWRKILLKPNKKSTLCGKNSLHSPQSTRV